MRRCTPYTTTASRLVVGINQRQIAVCLSIPVPLTWRYLSIDQRMGALASMIEVALVVMVAAGASVPR